MLKFFHAADLHLDSPFRGLDAAAAHQRREEQRELLSRLCGAAREGGAQLLILSGDLFDSGELYRETARALTESLGGVGMPVFIAPGNHDFYGPNSPYETLDWPENVHIFRSAGMERVELPELKCVVFGSAFVSPVREDEPLAGFAAPDDGNIRLMALHGEVGGSGRYGAVTPAQIAGSNLTYLALGHIHQGTGLQRAGNTFWAYPGCPEGRGFDETGDKGGLLVTVDGGEAAAELIPLAKRRYLICRKDVTGGAEEALSDLPGSENDIVRVELTGQSEGVDLAALEAELAGRFYRVQLRDRTTLPAGVWARAGEDSLTGLFLRAMRARLDGAADDGEREKLSLAARYGLAALENGEEVSP